MTEEKEIWKDIQGYEGLYQISNLGKVKSLNYNRTKKERILIPVKTHDGYLIVSLYKNCIHKNFLIHRLVAQTFIENPDNLLEVNHIDEDKTNNRADNLEWCSHEYNINFGTRNERIFKTLKLRNYKNAQKEVIQFTKDGKFVNEFPSIHEASRCTGINQGQICYCCKNMKRYTTAGGFKWKYKEDVK